MNIHAVVVTYYPNRNDLETLISQLQGAAIIPVLVDNSEHEQTWLQDLQVDYLPQSENLGIAKAQNIGIEHALRSSADAVLFFDQDTVVTKGALIELISTINFDQPQVVAPVFIDKYQKKEYPSLRVNRYGLRRKIRSSGRKSNYQVDAVISSGMLVTRQAIEIVGLMDEDFFIDYVDTEWCLRCRNAGIPIFVNPQSVMEHSIGDKVMDFIFFQVPVHKPFRRYYRVRNSFFLFRKTSVPKMLAIREVLFSIAHQVFLVVFERDRWAHISFFSKAVVDGLMYRTGRSCNHKNLKYIS